MPNLPETGEAPVTQVATQQGPLKRAAVEVVLNSLPAESLKENTFLGTGSAAVVAAKGEANVAYGAGALASATVGGENTAVGWNALTTVKTSGSNTAVGTGALEMDTAGKNTAVGTFAGKGTTTGGSNVFVGEGAGEGNVAGPGNVYIGKGAAEKANEATAEFNVVVGKEACAESEKLKGKNVVIGSAAAKENEGEGNIIIGASAGLTEKGSNKLYIANNGTTPIIQGVMSATAASQELGFYGTAPKAKPEVTGGTVTAKQLAEALATIGLVKVN